MCGGCCCPRSIVLRGDGTTLGQRVAHMCHISVSIRGEIIRVMSCECDALRTQCIRILSSFFSTPDYGSCEAKFRIQILYHELSLSTKTCGEVVTELNVKFNAFVVLSFSSSESDERVCSFTNIGTPGARAVQKHRNFMIFLLICSNFIQISLT